MLLALLVPILKVPALVVSSNGVYRALAVPIEPAILILPELSVLRSCNAPLKLLPW